MALPGTLQAHLDRHKASYQLLSHQPTQTLSEAMEATGVKPDDLVRAVLLTTGSDLLLTLLRADQLLDFQALKNLTGKDWLPARREEVSVLFHDCEPGSLPVIGDAYAIPTLVDEQLKTLSTICFEPGKHDNLICMDPQSFARITGNSQYATFARPLNVLESRNLNDFTLPGQAERALPLTELQPQQDIESMVRNIDRLPAMPNMARRLLRLRNDAHATIRDLTDIIQGDPSLTAQIVRYARSAFFNYQGKVETLEHAIGRVLGFETVLNMALGLAASRTFHNPADGPLGLQAFWRHATFSAALAQSLATRIKTHLPINPGVAYLAGLLHNFGFLLAGHLCRAEFFLLNKVVAANPHIPVRLIERRILGVDHTEMGGWLMEAWDMPAAIITSVREHHNELYDGEHALYTQLVFLVDQLLRAHNIGEGLDGEPSALTLNALGLDRATVEEMTLRVLESGDALDNLARQLAAA